MQQTLIYSYLDNCFQNVIPQKLSLFFITTVNRKSFTQNVILKHISLLFILSVFSFFSIFYVFVKHVDLFGITLQVLALDCQGFRVMIAYLMYHVRCLLDVFNLVVYISFLL